MKPNIKPELSRYKQKDTRQQVHVRVNYDGVDKYYPTDVRVQKKDWNKDGYLLRSGKLQDNVWVLASEQNYKEYNRLIVEEVGKLRIAINKLEEEGVLISAENIINKAKGLLDKKELDIIYYVNMELKRFVEAGKSTNYFDLKRSVALFLDFCKLKYKFEEDKFIDVKLDISIFTNLRIREFIEYLKTKQSRMNKVFNTASIKKFVDRLKYIVDIVHKDPNEVNRIFYKLKYPENAEHKKRNVSQETIHKLYNEYNTLSEARANSVRVFLFCYYAQGIRVGEAISIKVGDIQNGILQVVVEKSKGKKMRQIKLSATAMELISDKLIGRSAEDFLFEEYAYTSEMDKRRIGAVVNCNFKHAIKKLGITEYVTLHSARHTFITEGITKLEDIAKISKGVGHENISTTEGYGRFRVIKNDELNKVYQN